MKLRVAGAQIPPEGVWAVKAGPMGEQFFLFPIDLGDS